MQLSTSFIIHFVTNEIILTHFLYKLTSRKNGMNILIMIFLIGMNETNISSKEDFGSAVKCTITELKIRPALYNSNRNDILPEDLES